ncbi:MAG: metallophosphoesterase [Polyangiaceae bacterium]|nr:metallophosphoesterase [Polyangiaceae bacterium]
MAWTSTTKLLGLWPGLIAAIALLALYSPDACFAPASPGPSGLHATEWLEQGHTCAEPKSLSRGEVRKDCLAPDGVTRVERTGGPGGNRKFADECCVRVEPNSHLGIGGWLRRAQNGVIGLIAVPFLGAVLVGVLGALTASAGIVVTVYAAYVGRALRILLRARRAPVADRTIDFEATAPEGASIVLCQLTDLHQCVNPNGPYEFDHGSCAWKDQSGTCSDPTASDVDQRIRGLLKEVSSRKTPLVVLSGDVTDTGHHNEWCAFLGHWESVFPKHGSRPEPVLLPGNHDIAFNPADHADPALDRRAERTATFIAADSQLRRTVDVRFDSAGRALVKPIVCQALNDIGARLFALNSCLYPSTHMATNALGEIGKVQLDRLDLSLREYNGPVIVVLHHHICVPPDPSGSWSGKWLRRRLLQFLMSVIDARQLLLLLEDYAARDANNRVLVLHGHEHLRTGYEFMDGRIRVFGAPSSTLGTHLGADADGVSLLDPKPSYTCVWWSPEHGFRVSLETVEL